MATLAGQVRERAERVGSAPLLAAAAALGGPHRGAATSDTGPLTPRESEVARLIASGASNREIAAALHIAPKTVAAHVEQILAKLGAARRAEIAAWSATRTNRG